jgi:hypothetical protein
MMPWKADCQRVFALQVASHDRHDEDGTHDALVLVEIRVIGMRVPAAMEGDVV